MLGVWSILDESRDSLGARFITSLANRLSLGGKRVLILEACPKRPSLDVALGVAEKVVYTLSDVGSVLPRQAILTVGKNIDFVPCAVDALDVTASTERLAACIQADAWDVVLILFERAAYEAVKTVSDGVLLLTDPSFVSLRACAAFADAFPVSGCLLFDFVPTRSGVGAMPPLREITDMLGVPLLGILPRLRADNTSRGERKKFLLAVRNVAARLSGKQIPLLQGISLKRMRKKDFFER